MTTTVTKYTWTDMPKERVTPLLDRRLITAERMMLAHVYLKKGCIVPLHQHDNEQLTYMLEGALQVLDWERDRRNVVVSAGEVLVPFLRTSPTRRGLGGHPRRRHLLPAAADWLDKTDDYLRK